MAMSWYGVGVGVVLGCLATFGFIRAVGDAMRDLEPQVE